MIRILFAICLFSPVALKAADIIDVMIVYSQAAGSNIGQKNLDHAVINTNTIFKNSGIATRLRLVHTAQVSFSESNYTDSDPVLIAMKSKTDGVLDEIHSLRDQKGADLVILIVNAAGIWPEWTNGDANVMSVNDASMSEHAPFAIVEWSSLDSSAFSHEIGHTLGLRHDWYVSADKSIIYQYGRGMVNAGAGWRTVMAYEDQCLAQGKKCGRIPFFSNPNITYGGAPLGVAIGTNVACVNGVTGNPPCDAYDAQAIMNTSPTMAAFRSDVIARMLRPQVSAPTVNTSLATYTPTFTWQQSALATSYVAMIGLVPDKTANAFINESGYVLHYKEYPTQGICSGGICSIAPQMPVSDGNHYFAILVKGNGRQSLYTDPVDFVIYSDVMKGAANVTPLHPTSTDPISINTPSFTWNKTIGSPGVPEAAEYRVTISNTTTGNLVYYTDWMPASSVCLSGVCQFDSTVNLPSGNYNWRVKARGIYGEGAYGTRLYFSVS